MTYKELIDKIWQKEYEVEILDGKRVPTKKKIIKKDGWEAKGLAMFIDMKNSTIISSDRKQKTLMRLYTSYQKSIMKVIREYCQKNLKRIPLIYVVGDGLYCVFDVQNKEQIKELFPLTDEIFEVVDYIDEKWKGQTQSEDNIEVGIGMSLGDHLVFKLEGTSSTLWMGKIVNYSSKFSGFSCKNNVGEIVVDSEIKDLLDNIEFKLGIDNTTGIEFYSTNRSER